MHTYPLVSFEIPGAARSKNNSHQNRRKASQNNTMASMSEKISALFDCAVSGLAVGVLFRFYVRLLNNLEEAYRTYMGNNFGALHAVAEKSVYNFLISVTVLFLHFVVAKRLQNRYMALQQQLLVVPVTFWVAIVFSITLSQPTVTRCGLYAATRLLFVVDKSVS